MRCSEGLPRGLGELHGPNRASIENLRGCGVDRGGDQVGGGTIRKGRLMSSASDHLESLDDETMENLICFLMAKSHQDGSWMDTGRFAHGLQEWAAKIESESRIKEVKDLARIVRAQNQFIMVLLVRLGELGIGTSTVGQVSEN